MSEVHLYSQNSPVQVSTCQGCQATRAVWNTFLPPGEWTTLHSLVSSANLTEGGFTVSDSGPCHRQCPMVLFPVVTPEACHSSLVSTWAPSHPLYPWKIQKKGVVQGNVKCFTWVQGDSISHSSVTHQYNGSVTLSLKFAIEFVKHHLPLVKPCWLSPTCHLCFPCALPSFQGLMLVGPARHRTWTDWPVHFPL